MPPSRSLRRSPGMETHVDSHRRGHSLECGLPFKAKEKDDDLALFNEMQSRESDKFLLQPTDDFEDILMSKPKPFPEIQLGINIPARGANSDLLNADGDKNDYEWLLTPPDTPLFRSLDDEPAAPVNLVHSGRERSRPISISRSSTMERNHRSRGSPSPRCLSPSPQGGAFRGRPSSAPHASPVPLRPSSPSRKPSPPPVKSSTPRRSSTPTSQRLSAGSGGSRGNSPVRTSRGNSASPKIRAWQSNVPGFSLDAPPNLRTSLADRPASYVRGSSPASSTSRNSSSKIDRRSMSPAASRSIRRSVSPAATRSISSSHSQERDRLSSHSRVSLASSSDDEANSLQSVPLIVSECTTSRKGAARSPGGKPSAVSKKLTKTSSASSAPKRSFDSAMRQLERKSPQNMFRPLLSGVPSSTFYAGQTSSVHCGMVSRNSSVTTSTNTEGNDHYQDDVVSDCATAPYIGIEDEVIAFDKTDGASDITYLEAHDILPELQFDEPDKTCAFASNGSEVQNDFMEIHSLENSLVCSRCGGRYHHMELPESDNNICPECKQKQTVLTSPSLISSETTPNTPVPSLNISEESKLVDPILTVPQLQIVMGADHPWSVSEMQEEITLESKGPDSQPNDSCIEQSAAMVSEQLVTEENRSIHNTSCAVDASLDVHKCGKKPVSNIEHCENPDSNVDIAEHTGISVLILKRSSSAKGPLVHGRNLNRSAVSYDDLSYTRDLSSSMTSSTGHGSYSTISSVDLSSTRHQEMLVRRHLSGKRSDTSSKPQSTVSSLSGSLMQVFQGLGVSMVSHEENCEGCSSNMSNIVAGEKPESPLSHLVLLENTESSVSKTVLGEEISHAIYVSSGEHNPSVMDQHTACTVLEDNSQVSIIVDEGHVLHEVNEDHEKRTDIVPNAEELALLESSVAKESTRIDNGVDEVERGEDLTQCSLSTTTEVEIDNSHPSSPRSQIDMAFKDLEDHSTHMHPKKDPNAQYPDSSASDHAERLVEESTVTVENQGGGRTRSLTLEEATDTILFCSSIVHDLAYKAASISIEKEKENLEPFQVPRPTVTIPERREDFHGITTGRTVTTQKARKRHGETALKPPPLTENDNRSNEPVVQNVGIPDNAGTMKSPKLESKCNCTIM